MLNYFRLKINKYVMKNFDVFSIGLLNNVKANEKIFIKDKINTTSLEMSFQNVPANTKAPFLHIHKQNEEIYMILKGEGTFQANDEIFNISEGDIIRVKTGVKRAINAVSNMSYICIQAKENSLEQLGFDDAEIIK